ncbi:zf-HC2 domain-containing protein [Denitratisoma oestradiolicum]|uniref:Putative zinc-finger domain-containing protein n=1 Tax=Denitratisoma oestradiolicum TaxID=311182 RepID=A0A6S6Y8I9_9PROT|nr:zf-HC2 domain-containing protein [Denitratisoma oestradiolicum]TWO81907.1 hypothetical protein CBW56_00190 [Denitratisoma oestradiolicum]CAB1368798.1 conserved protein of unknown function [Denitratisoma oestradiolicum]
MLTCKQATAAMSQAQDRKLGLRERMNLGMHLLMCRGCRAFNRQLAFLRRAGHRLAGNDGEPPK